MQCFNCGFENIPGLRACARCASTLDLAGVEVDPPRASKLHTATLLQRMRYRLRSLIPDLSAVRAGFRRLMPEPLDPNALVWSFIPGLGHILSGRRRLGRVLLPAWLVFLVLAMLSLGTNWTGLWFSLMIAVHALAIVSLFAAHLAYERFLMRAVFGVLLFLGLRFFIYEPVGWLGSRFIVAAPIHGVMRGDFIARGDGLLFEGPWLRPDSFARGDIVIYQINEIRGPGYYLRSGFGVDRIVGSPGDRVQVTGGRLLVNGDAARAGEGPLGRLPAMEGLDIELRSQEYAVFPSLLPHNFTIEGQRRLPPDLARRLSVRTYDQILGRIWIRTHPLSRFGRIG